MLVVPRWIGVIVVSVVATAQACHSSQGVGNSSETPSANATAKNAEAIESEKIAFRGERRRMVDDQLRSRDITDARVLAAMERVPRHLFVPERLQPSAYEDRPLPIGDGQTISQPYIVALMTQLGALKPQAKALDIGTGSGYQAAILAELCQQVYSIEIVETLARDARARLEQLGYRNIEVRHGDGYRGWIEHAPFDVIIVAAAPDHIPQPLIDQLAPNGRLVIPVGRAVEEGIRALVAQDLLVVEKSATGEIRQRTVTGVAFVPMTGEAKKK